MSATNSTTTIGLSQYISTDKPTYLTDYNGDMLKIDNAIASDRDGIATAQNKANTADGKADANKTSIDTLNAQINGNPSDPSDSGLAGKVNTIDGNVNTINSLLGNGSPTTSDQTVIGAINDLEDTIAPSEDDTTLGANYVTGKKFMRGGTLYEALVDLTSGTAFSSLVLNTDYKVADRITKQIDDNKTSIGEINGHLTNIATMDGFTGLYSAVVTGDGTKTYSELLTELANEVETYLATAPVNERITNLTIEVQGFGFFGNTDLNQWLSAGGQFNSGSFANPFTTAEEFGIGNIRMGAKTFKYGAYNITSSQARVDDLTAVVVPNGNKISLFGQKYDKLA